jgi:RNA polymerase sigma-70 factor, ECF subfamily
MVDMASTDDQRFEELYRRHAADVLAYCARRMSRDEATDAAADVFVVVLRRISEVPQGESALPWLYVVARNVLYNRRRSSRRRVRLAAKLFTTTDASVPGPEPQVVRNEDHERLIAAINALPETDREIIRLVQWEGLSREVVAGMFFVSRAAIDQRLSRAYRKLRRALGTSFEDRRTAPVTIEEGGEA